jgi:adenylate cyclase
MADLMVQGLDPESHWRRSLPEGESLILGRNAGDWTVCWDKHISRQHAEVTWYGGRLWVRRLPTALNPIYVAGRPLDDFDAGPGDRFVIGSTLFTVCDEPETLLIGPAQSETLQAGLTLK